MESLLASRETQPGVLECRVNLGLLYPDQFERSAFENRWPHFVASDPDHAHVFWREGGDCLVYRSEALIPVITDGRPPVLLLLGNPASHSIASGMFFAFEGANRAHRFWATLREAGILDFGWTATTEGSMRSERNRAMKQALLDLEYRSPFRIGIAMFFSMPSTASKPPWSGVRGLTRLLGRRALRLLGVEEQGRIASLIRAFMPMRRAVLTFQRDAYEWIRASCAPTYSLDDARAGRLCGTYGHHPGIHLFCAPPTRLMHSQNVKEVLKQYQVRMCDVLKSSQGGGPQARECAD